MVPSETHQLRFCLGDGHRACPLLTDPSPRPPRRAVASFAPRRPDRRTSPRREARGRTLRRGALVVLGVALAVVTAVATAFVLASSGAPDASAPAGVDATATAVPTATIAGPPTSTPVATSTPVPSPTRVGSYVVKPGDSYALIAQQFGLSVEELVAANNRTKETPLFPGQVLTIP